MTIVLEDYKGFQKTITWHEVVPPPQIRIPIYQKPKPYDDLSSATTKSLIFYRDSQLTNSVYLYKSEEEL